MTDIKESEMIDGYLLGILWGTCSTHHSYLFCRHRDQYYPNYVAAALGGHIRLQKSRTDDQYAVHLPIKYPYLYKYGWSPRNNDIRDYPLISDDLGFVTAWIELHHSIGIAKHKNGSKYARLRIYGNKFIMDKMEPRIANLAGVENKKVQILQNSKTGAIYYQSRHEISRIADLLRNPTVKNNIQSILVKAQVLRLR